jgi:hypothetical protein
MVDSEGPTGRALELAGSATLAKARRRTAVAAVARPAAEVAGLLLVEGLGSPRGGRPRSAWHDHWRGDLLILLLAVGLPLVLLVLRHWRRWRA